MTTAHHIAQLKNALIFLAMSFVATNCTSTSSRIGDHIAGHPFASDRDCRRTKPLGTFDPVCDHPRLGYRGGWDPTIPIQSGGLGGLGH